MLVGWAFNLDDGRLFNAPRGADLPLKPARTIRFTTDEGTWMSLDLSSDGRALVFDLAGDIYTLPVAGGKATRITSGMPFDAQPRWSPDGKTIVYVTDRDGSDDVWVMDPDGKNQRQITRTDRTQFVSPYHFAYVYTGLGEHDRAVEMLERAVAARTGATYGINGSFLLAPLRGHPRFQALLRTMSLA